MWLKDAVNDLKRYIYENYAVLRDGDLRTNDRLSQLSENMWEIRKEIRLVAEALDLEWQPAEKGRYVRKPPMNAATVINGGIPPGPTLVR